MSRFFQGATRGHEGVRAHGFCRFRRRLPRVCPFVPLPGLRLPIMGIIVSLNPRVFGTARAAGRGNIRAAGAGEPAELVCSGIRCSDGAEDRADGGHRGAMPIDGGAVFQCRTLEWVVRNIPKKIGTILINGLVCVARRTSEVERSWSAASESHNNRYRPRNKERFKNGNYHHSNRWQLSVPNEDFSG